jgi:hypothetical protein
LCWPTQRRWESHADPAHRSTAAAVQCEKEYKCVDLNSDNAEVYPDNCGFVTPEESAARGYSITNDYSVATAATRRPASDSFILKAPRTNSVTHRRHIKSLQQLATESIYSKDATTATGSGVASHTANAKATDHREAIAELYQQLKALHVTRRRVCILYSNHISSSTIQYISSQLM